MKRDANDLRAELLAAGSRMPVDSLDLFDVLVEFRQVTGITLPKRKLRRRFMRSVKDFADFASKEGR
jgi:acyl carrier protein